MTLSQHAIQRMVRRRISLEEVRRALAQPPRWHEPKRTHLYCDPDTGVTCIVDPYGQLVITVMVVDSEKARRLARQETQ